MVPPNPSDPCFDILSASYALLWQSHIKWFSHHVKGHQDDESPLGELDRWALLNIQMDRKAKELLCRAVPGQRHFTVPHEAWSIWKDDVKLSKDRDNAMYTIVHAIPARKYWGGKSDLTNKELSTVDWEAALLSSKQVPITWRNFILKHSTGMCGVGKFIFHWQQRPSLACPRCGMMEDAQHVWVCKGCDSRVVWDSSLSSVKSWMASKNTNPDIQHQLLAHLNSWWEGISGPSFIPPFLWETIAQQSKIGWNRCLEGWFSRGWAIDQQQYFDKTKSSRSGKWWLSALITKLWGLPGTCDSIVMGSYTSKRTWYIWRKTANQNGRWSDCIMF